MKPLAWLTTLSLLALMLGPLAALAVAQSASATVLKVNEPSRTSTRGRLALSASLTAAGRPVSDRPVDFYVQVTLFGPRDALIGTATTDSTGVAILLYEPAWRGRQTIVAKFAGGTGYAPAEANATFDIREIVEPFAEEPAPLASIRQWLPVALSGVVVAVWATLFGTLISAALGIRADARARRASASALPVLSGGEPSPRQPSTGGV